MRNDGLKKYFCSCLLREKLAKIFTGMIFRRKKMKIKQSGKSIGGRGYNFLELERKAASKATKFSKLAIALQRKL